MVRNGDLLVAYFYIYTFIDMYPIYKFEKYEKKSLNEVANRHFEESSWMNNEEEGKEYENIFSEDKSNNNISNGLHSGKKSGNFV